MSVNIPKVSDMPQESSTLGLTPETPDRGGMRTQTVDHGTPISQLITQFQQQWSANAEEGKRRIVRKERASSRFAELETSSWNDE